MVNVHKFQRFEESFKLHHPAWEEHTPIPHGAGVQVNLEH